jgi:SET domain-containing protein
VWNEDRRRCILCTRKNKGEKGWNVIRRKTLIAATAVMNPAPEREFVAIASGTI